MAVRAHHFAAVAFVENLVLKDLAAAFPEGRLTSQELIVPLLEGGEVFLYPFGAIVFHDATSDRRATELARLQKARPGLTTQIVHEEYVVQENPKAPIGVDQGVMSIDYFTPARSAVIALTVGQSAAMEYYESEVERLFSRTAALELKLEKYGNLSMATKTLHRFIGEAISTRSEVVTVLHLLDKPEATWDDQVLGDIYDDLKAEFDLGERHEALEMKIESVIESLGLMLDVARDRRMFWLEVAIVVMILFEIVMSFVRTAH